MMYRFVCRFNKLMCAQTHTRAHTHTRAFESRALHECVTCIKQFKGIISRIYSVSRSVEIKRISLATHTGRRAAVCVCFVLNSGSSRTTKINCIESHRPCTDIFTWFLIALDIFFPLLLLSLVSIVVCLFAAISSYFIRFRLRVDFYWPTGGCCCRRRRRRRTFA